MHLQTEAILFLFLDDFISFPCLIALPRKSSTMLNRNDKNEHLCLVPNLRCKVFSSSPLSMLATGLPHTAFSMFKYFTFLSRLLRDLCHKNKLNLPNTFSAHTEMVMSFSSFVLLMCYLTFIDFHTLNHSYLPEINPTVLGWDFLT